ncbi:hypothetical protein QBC46DRAFT_460969 [Diplogelasinospora grovesii]|uniref:AAA+ ATPase domain-containing protein n=1 Tax=Diplogelasinospora grovesii TaxID=303347 RepID=A0AAN6N1F8_9PEZI|nr:hypothetical protein QBC46DRAFT_460969 [Diplogelasinospora grovesii]
MESNSTNPETEMSNIPDCSMDSSVLALPARGQGDDAPRRRDSHDTSGTRPKHNRVDWFLFKKLARVQESEACVIDILIGKPIPADDRTDVRQSHGLKALPWGVPDQEPLPERIRIHSTALMWILAEILGGNWKPIGVNKYKTAVFIRPFKVLIDCERALRDRCEALEKKFESDSMPERDVSDAVDYDQTGSTEEAERGSENKGARAEEALQADNPMGVTNNELNKVDKLTKSRTALEHLRCLLSFIDSDIVARQAYLNSPECKQHLFQPGVDVIIRECKQAYRVTKVASSPRCAAHLRTRDCLGHARFSIFCVNIDFDGKKLGPVRRIYDFYEFDGLADVTSLKVYPIRFHPAEQVDFSRAEWKEVKRLPEKERYRQKLVRLGAKFLDAVRVKPMYYAGPTLEVGDQIESQVVVDFEMALTVQDSSQQQWRPEVSEFVGKEEDEPPSPGASFCGVCPFNDSVLDDGYVDRGRAADYIESLRSKGHAGQPSVVVHPRSVKELEVNRGSPLAVPEDELVIMSHRVFGFVLRSRKWAKLHVSYLSELYSPETTDGKPDPDDDEKREVPKTAFDRLVLGAEHRSIIKSLIAQHFRDRESMIGHGAHMDIVKGKGQGLVLLLHGPPGLGKTSTAEGVAELFKKPLFQITSGDLGTTAEVVEKVLATDFSLASRWGCILLLDEADVFLAARQQETAFKRNGLVAVFLRALEYYTGILFLTTNRIGDFDEAFTSRIHISLYYPALDQDKTVEVFSINLDMIEERFGRMGRRIEIARVDIGKFAANHFTDHRDARWNGRQIRNACQTALALAESEAQGNAQTVTHQNPDAVVKLGVRHFEEVRKAYLEFNKYMHSLRKLNTSRHANKIGARAIWVDEDGGTGLGVENVHDVGTQGQLQPQPQPPQMQQMQMQMPMQMPVQMPVRQQFDPGSQAQGQQHWSSNQPATTSLGAGGSAPSNQAFQAMQRAPQPAKGPPTQ